MSTTISITNETTVNLTISNGVNPTLGTGCWNAIASSVPAGGETVQVLEFNRDEGITNGDTWTFSSEATIDGVAVSLQEKITGTLIGSTMAQQMIAGSQATGFLDTGENMTVNFTGDSGGAYQLTWSLSLNGSLYDNVLYTLEVTS